MSAKIVNNRIEGTRITVWDVLHYLENGRSAAAICRWLPITEEQVAAVVDYADENREYVMKVHREIEERNARGNPPEIRQKLAETRRRMEQWLKEKRQSRMEESAGAGNPGGH